jgi:hypothetical protein
MATIYIHYIFFLSFRFNLILEKLLSVVLCWKRQIFLCFEFLVFLNWCYFFLFFYFYTTTITITITTITSSTISEGEGTLETSYKLWSFEFRSFEGKKERIAPKLVLLPTLGLGSTYTRFHYSIRSVPSDATPHTLTFLVHGFWGQHLGYALLCVF